MPENDTIQRLLDEASEISDHADDSTTRSICRIVSNICRRALIKHKAADTTPTDMFNKHQAASDKVINEQTEPNRYVPDIVSREMIAAGNDVAAHMFEIQTRRTTHDVTEVERMIDEVSSDNKDLLRTYLHNQIDTVTAIYIAMQRVNTRMLIDL